MSSSLSTPSVLPLQHQTLKTPAAIVAELDKYIIGQSQAKKAVAIALRNRLRRLNVPEPLRNEIVPKNILMIGPTGVGKTEIARRLAKLAKAPFVKVEATKFTEVGYVGRDVDSIVRDLVEAALQMVQEEAFEQVRDQAESHALDALLKTLMPHITHQGTPAERMAAQNLLKQQLDSGELDEQIIEIDVKRLHLGVEIMAPPGMEEMTQQLQGLLQSLSHEKTRKKKLKIKEAWKYLREEAASKLINEEDLKSKAITRAEEAGIVFIDEIDKITQRSEGRAGAEISREGVQRDLLPLIEGSTVSTKYGQIKTDHVLFIASGAFHVAKPSDLIPELQGRLPIRVELEALTEENFFQILTETDACLTKQYQALLATEGVHLVFDQEGVRVLAKVAADVNARVENIGARRLHTILEKVLEEPSFQAETLSGQTVVIDAAFVHQALGALTEAVDLSRFIL